MDERYKRICEAVIKMAGRRPARRGPFVFDEYELQEQAVLARAWLKENA